MFWKRKNNRIKCSEFDIVGYFKEKEYYIELVIGTYELYKSVNNLNASAILSYKKIIGQTTKLLVKEYILQNSSKL